MRGKTVFFDIDGTLVDRMYNMPPSTAEALRRLRENGHRIFICTGRTNGHIQSPVLLNAGFNGIISGCGTMIEYHQEVLYYHRIESELAEHTVRTVKSHGFRPILEGREYLYMDESDFDLSDAYGNKLRRELGHHLRTIQGDWGEWEISKLSCATENIDCTPCFEALADHYEYLIHNYSVVEMVPKGHDKSTGIERVCRALNIAPEDTIAFGDATNDLGMLSVVHTAVAMGNAQENVKQAADYVTADIWEDGIWKGCRHLGLI